MKWLRFLAAGVFLAAAGALLAAEPEPTLTLDAMDPQGEFVVYDLPSGVFAATNGAIVRYADMVLTATYVEVNQANTTVRAEGNVRLLREGLTWMGESVLYDYKNRFMQSTNFRCGQSPYFAGGASLSSTPSNNTYVARNAFVTSDDLAKPIQRVRAHKLVIVPGKYMEAYSATLYVGKVPVMYLPYYRCSLNRRGNYWEVTPGYRSRYGAYLHGVYHWELNDQLSGALNFDYRTRRGPGAGPDFFYDLGRWGQGELGYYYAKDYNAGTNTFNSEENNPNRHRVSYYHKANLASNLTARLVANYQTDAAIARDFFEEDYRRNVQPGTYAELNHTWNNWSLDGLAIMRLNRFYDTIERLPDLKLTGFRQQLGESPFFYESETSLGWYRRLYGNDIKNSYTSGRGDTYHQLVLPQTFLGWLNVTPRVGGRFTAYSEAEGVGTTTSAQSRGVFNTGVETSLKVSRLWKNERNKFFEVDGIRHIVQPSVNYVFVPTPSQQRYDLPQFDYEQPGYRLLPIDYPDYNAIDSVDSQNTMRLALRNKLQTKRESGIENLVNWALYTDWRLNPRPDQNTFADYFSDLDFSPRSWLSLSQVTRYDVESLQLKEITHYLTLKPCDIWSFQVGNRYLRNDPLLGPNSAQNLYFTTFYLRFNENYGLRTTHHFDARQGKLQEQTYTLYRDLRSWTAALNFRIRSDEGQATDYHISVRFSFKAFPRASRGSDSLSHSWLIDG